MKRISLIMVDAEDESALRRGFLSAVKAIDEHGNPSGIGIDPNHNHRRLTFTVLDESDNEMGIQKLSHVIDIVDSVISLLAGLPDKDDKSAPEKPANELAAMKDVMNLINKLKEAK